MPRNDFQAGDALVVMAVTVEDTHSVVMAVNPTAEEEDFVATEAIGAGDTCGVEF